MDKFYLFCELKSEKTGFQLIILHFIENEEFTIATIGV